MSNLKLWDSVEKTNPKHTKKVTFGRAITAIDPYRQIKNATEKFGPVGIGWGWTVERVEYLPTNEVGLLIRMWHTSKENTFDQWGQASLFIDNNEKKKDKDCFKKATTDGITKCLSFIGFNADVFLGKFDDNKYVQQMHDEFSGEDLIKAISEFGWTNEQVCKSFTPPLKSIKDVENINDCIKYLKENKAN